MENTGDMTLDVMIGIAKFVGLVTIDIGVAAWLLYRKITLVEENEFGFQVFRWVVATNSFLILIWWVIPLTFLSPMFALVGILGMVACGIVIGLCITPTVVGSIIGLFTGDIDGANQQSKPTPIYSLALARRNRGEPQKALEMINEQLERFPSDYEGLMLIAEIHAYDLRNLPAARQSLEDLLEQGDYPAGRKSAILTTMADWELELAKDTEGARRAFERIIDLFPNTELAHKAEQRIHRLPTTQVVDERGETRQHTLPSQRTSTDAKESRLPGDRDPDAEARELADHLIGCPDDDEARERLALLYAEHYKRVDMAADQLEHLICDPVQPRDLTVRRLNLLAQFYMRHALNGEEAKICLKRIIDMFPGSAAAQLAEQDLNRVPDSATLQKRSNAVPLSKAEKDLGLKGKSVEWR